MRIELIDIHKRFGAVHANDGISLVIAEGSIQGLLGENGAGKSTLMKVLSGYQSCDHGHILVDGQSVRFRSPAEAIRRGIGMLHQDPLDVPPLSVLDNFTLGRGTHFLQRRKQGRQALHELCTRFGFSLDPEATVSSLTIGERQQLELARLLSLGIRLIILDEPTTGISAPQKDLLFATLRRLASQGLSVVFVSHKLDEVGALCSRATILRRGRVAGEVSAPFSSDQLVALMFGQCLSARPRDPARLGEVVLELEDVSVQSYQLAIDRVSLALRQREILGLAGLEGSGQRLFMQACAGLQRAATGRLRLGSREMTREPYGRYLEAGVAYVPAARLEEGMAAGLTIREHVALTMRPRGLLVPWHQAEQAANRMIREFNIVGRPETPVQALSGGNQQRLLLALLPDRLRLLLLEHPTRGLDVESSQWVWERLLKRRDDQTAIIFTSTDLDELVQYSDRIMVFSGGSISPAVDASATTCEELGHLIGGGGR